MPGSLRVVETLLPIVGAARRARNVVTEACIRWDVSHLLWPATLIVSELVSNVVEHAHTIMTLDVALQESSLYLAVSDGSSAPPILRAGKDTPTTGGRGLQFVDALSRSWGYNADTSGKIVWATLALDRVQGSRRGQA